MLTFNNILSSEGVDPRAVRLVRHVEPHAGPRLYEVWRRPNGPQLINKFQSQQGQKKFNAGDHLASFLVTPPPRSETVFVGLFKVMGISSTKRPLTDPVYGNDFNGWEYDIEPDHRLDDYIERLLIEWGPAGRSQWVQRASERDKPILALLRDPEDQPFPGFDRFYMDLEQVPTMYASWATVLSHVKGVYLLVDRDDGKQYVGSAKGELSLLGRMREYAKDGHGGDVELKKRTGARYRVSVLEVVQRTFPDEPIERMEAAWKEKLMTRKYGLNHN